MGKAILICFTLPNKNWSQMAPFLMKINELSVGVGLPRRPAYTCY